MFEAGGYSPPLDLAGYARLESNIELLGRHHPELAREARCFIGQNDLYYLARYVSSMRLVKRRFLALDGSGRIEERNMLDVPVALDVARIVQSQSHRSLFIGGRGMLKSAMLVLDIIRLMIVNPNGRQLVLRSVKDLAKVHLAKIREELETNPRWGELWPDVFWASPQERRKSKAVWSPNNGLTVKRSVAALEATVTAAGALDGLPIGYHFDHIHGDDIEEPRNVSITELPKLQTLNEKVGPLLAGLDSRFRVIGTYHHPEGYHAKMLPDAGWQVITLPSVDPSNIPQGHIEVKSGDGTRKVAWAEIGGMPRYELPEYLAQQFLDMRGFQYNVQYLCRKPTEWAREMDPNQVKWQDHSQIPEEVRLRGSRVLLVDPGHNKGPSSDPSCFLVVSLYKTGSAARWILVESGYYSPFLRVSGRVKVAMALIKRYSIQSVRWEAYGQVEDHLELIDALRAVGISGVSVTPVNYRGTKADRARTTIQPLLEAGELYCPKYLPINEFPPANDTDIPRPPECDLAQLLRQSLTDFPAGGGHLLDCLSLLSERQKSNPPPRLPWGNVTPNVPNRHNNQVPGTLF
jgi:hypothetical protein